MNYNRRRFLQSSGTLVLGGLALSGRAGSILSAFPHHQVGIQLFTFFNVIDADVNGTLKKIAAIGYKEIESAFSKKGGYYGLKPQRL